MTETNPMAVWSNTPSGISRDGVPAELQWSLDNTLSGFHSKQALTVEDIFIFGSSERLKPDFTLCSTIFLKKDV